MVKSGVEGARNGVGKVKPVATKLSFQQDRTSWKAPLSPRYCPCKVHPNVDLNIIGLVSTMSFCILPHTANLVALQPTHSWRWAWTSQAHYRAVLSNFEEFPSNTWRLNLVQDFHCTDSQLYRKVTVCEAQLLCLLTFQEFLFHDSRTGSVILCRQSFLLFQLLAFPHLKCWDVFYCGYHGYSIVLQERI